MPVNELVEELIVPEEEITMIDIEAVYEEIVLVIEEVKEVATPEIFEEIEEEK